MAPTVMLMTLNEERNIPSAIASFPKGTRIVLYDSFSTDRTVELAKELGVVGVWRRECPVVEAGEVRGGAGGSCGGEDRGAGGEANQTFYSLSIQQWSGSLV